MTEESLLIIFIKNPQKGYVKTRLASSVGDNKALEIYKKLIDYTRSVVKGVKVDRQVWYSRFIPDTDSWDTKEFARKLQAGGDLGEKMQNAFDKAFQDGYRKVVIIGSDCARLTTGLLDRAFSCLEKNNLVVGPSEDGGYYLLGMNSYYGELFEGLAWSTSTVLSDTLQIAERLDLEVELLPELNDVDTEEDWLSVKDEF